MPFFQIICFNTSKQLSPYAQNLQKRLQKSLQIHFIDPKKAQKASPEALWSDLARKIPKNAFIFALDELGQDMTSTKMSQKLEKLKIAGRSVVFLVGPADGWPKKELIKANFWLSFGKMTWTYNLCLTMLLEQVYRAEEIMKGSRFHR